MPAIKISGGGGTSLKNVNISGFDIGVQSHDGGSFSSQDVTFDNVRQPYDVHGGEAHVERNKVLNDPLVKSGEHKNVYSGWRRNGPPLPSQCPHCKTVFPSRNYDFGTSKFYSRNNEETCRECGRDGAKLADGLFDLTAEAVRIIQGPDLTHAMLAAIIQTANAAFDETIEPDEIISRLEAIDASLGALAKRVSDGSSSGLAWFSAVIGFAAMVAACLVVPATLESRDLAREQTALAREALAISKAPNPSDEIMKHAARDLADIKFVLRDQTKTQADNSHNAPGRTPSKNESPTETGSMDLNSEQIQKPRRFRRRSASGHRYRLHCCCGKEYSRR